MISQRSLRASQPFHHLGRSIRLLASQEHQEHRIRVMPTLCSLTGKQYMRGQKNRNEWSEIWGVHGKGGANGQYRYSILSVIC